MGVYQIIGAPQVFKALDPSYAIDFFARNGLKGYLVLGSVFLCATGGEAIYADIGHFGVLPIRISWFSVVLPGLILNYTGQAALLLQNPGAAGNPFFNMVPGWALYFVVAFATAAAIVASQAVISGSFSVIRQAIQLGFLPRMKVKQTSTKEAGQIYMPAINWFMMIVAIALVYGFGSSSALAGVYGVGISFSMVITSILFASVTWLRWDWNLAKIIPLVSIFLIVDLAFFGANVVKVLSGGWFQILVAIIAVTVMTTWRRGRQILGERLKSSALPIQMFVDDVSSYSEVEEDDIKRVRGTAVYMYSNPKATPPALLHNIKHNKVIHENIVVINVRTTDDKPYVSTGERINIEELGKGFYRLQITNGFAQNSNVPRVLRNAENLGLDIDMDELTYFLGKESILPTGDKNSAMAKWRDRLFDLFTRNEQPATKYFGLPPNRVVEIGAQVEL